MISPAATVRYKNHRFLGEIISHGVWLYYRFTLSYRDVQELLFERGLTVSHEAIRQWCRKFGQAYAKANPVADGLDLATSAGCQYVPRVIMGDENETCKIPDESC